MTVDRGAVVNALLGARWVFAKTMPKTPHFYTLRADATSDEQFEAFVLHIREVGYSVPYAGRMYTYLDVDGHKYWTMGAPVKETTLINRAELLAPAAPSIVATAQQVIGALVGSREGRGVREEARRTTK